MSNFQIEGLSAERFRHLFEMSDESLGEIGVKRMTVDAKPGYPCRVSLEDAEVGETVLLLTYAHLDMGASYDASGPIYVREGSHARKLAPGVLPPMAIRSRLYSLRTYDESGWMIKADVVSGDELESSLNSAFEGQTVAFVDAHNARVGCFGFRARRV